MLDHIITSLKAKITQTLELYTADVEPVYLLTFIQDILRQAGQVNGPVTLKEDAIFDQILTKFKSLYPPQLVSDVKATHRAKCISKIMDARINPGSHTDDYREYAKFNPGSHTDDYREYAKFDSLESMKQQLLKSSLANNTSPASCPRPDYLLTKDFINEIRQNTLDKATADANASAHPPRGRPLYRSRSRSRSDRSSHSSGRSSRSRDKYPRFRHPGRSFLLDADDTDPADAVDQDTAYCHLMIDLYNVAVETKNDALIELLENASSLYLLATEREPDDEEVAAGLMCLSYQTCEALSEQDPSQHTWEIAWAMAHIVAGSRLPRLPRGLRDRLKQKRKQLTSNANTTSFADGRARSAQKHPQLRDGDKGKDKKSARDKKTSHRKHRSPGRVRQDQHPNSAQNKASPMEQLALKMKQLMRLLEQPKPAGTDPNVWYRQQVYQGLQMIQEMLLKIQTRLPKTQHKKAVRTVASHWTYCPPAPGANDGAESDTTAEDSLF